MRPMKILVTAGPTREPIDPVRFISNYSTGTMGYAVAKAAAKRGHSVILVSGPTSLNPPKLTKIINVITAEEMFKAVKRESKNVDCVIMAAAVADFRPVVCCKKKLKRVGSLKNLKLQKNIDILSWLGRQAHKKILAGFCMETENLLNNAKKKMDAKRLDIIVANKIDNTKNAFGENKTSVIVLGPGNKKLVLRKRSKKVVAGILLDKIEKL